MSHDQAFQKLHASLNAVQQETMDITELCQTWRAQTALIADLPDPYGEVMEDLLSRLESGSLFAEESCSFSQSDLLTTLNMWLENAQQTLA